MFDDTDFLEGRSYVDLFSNQESGGCGLELNNDGTVDFYVHTGGKYVHPGCSTEYGEPVHIVGTYDRRSVKVYINGVLMSSETAAPPFSPAGSEDAQFLCIGGDSGYSGETEANFTGKIVTANVYGRALTASEISALYSQYEVSDDTFDFIPESGYQFNSEDKMLYGIPLTELTAENIRNAFTNENLFVEADGKIGTGTKIVLKNDNGEVYDAAEVVVFGDVNGDGRYDGTDSVIVNCIVGGILSEKCVGKAVYTAADCNHDGTIDCNDVVLLEQAGLLLACVNQCKSTEKLQADSVYVHYLSLIEQSTDEIITEKNDSSAPKICTVIDKIIAFFINIINSIKALFA